ncbi:isocitrate dehydrogenase [NAD] regulatory subunit 1, mitochondrial-like, partial [Olea europaea subsp. europaea]
FKDKTKEEEALKALEDKLAVFELEQSIGREVNKVDCLEEEVPIRELDDEVMRITKFGYAQAQDPLIKVNISNEGEGRPIFVNQMLDQEVNDKLIALLKEFKDCFAWEYEHMTSLDRDLVEHRLPTKPNFKPHKQPPRHFAPNLLPEIKNEIERLLKIGFIRIDRYVEWLSNIVTPNLYGNLVANTAAGIAGGTGVMPGGNAGADYAVFEQGASAGNVGNTNLVEQRRANPIALLLSSAMMLRHLQFPSFADRLETAVKHVISEGKYRTKDLGGDSTTQQVVDAVIAALD